MIFSVTAQTIQGLVTVLINVGAVGVSAALIRAHRRNLNANTDNTLVTTASTVAAELRLEMTRLQDQVEILRTELDYERARKYQIEAWSRILFAEVIEAGGIPTPLEQVPMPAVGE